MCNNILVVFAHVQLKSLSTHDITHVRNVPGPLPLNHTASDSEGHGDKANVGDCQCGRQTDSILAMHMFLCPEKASSLFRFFSTSSMCLGPLYDKMDYFPPLFLLFLLWKSTQRKN